MWKLTQHILIWQRPCFYSRCHRMIVYEKTRFCKHLSIRVVFFFFCQGICVLDSHGWTLVVGLSWLDSHGWTLAYPTRDQNSVLCSSLLFCFFFWSHLCTLHFSRFCLWEHAFSEHCTVQCPCPLIAICYSIRSITWILFGFKNYKLQIFHFKI